MSVFPPASKREGKGKQRRGIMWKCAGPGVSHRAKAMWGFPLHSGCIPSRCPEPQLCCYLVKY